MNTPRLLVAGLAIVAATVASGRDARAQTYSFAFAGSGVHGALALTYGAATDPRYHNGYEVTGISGSFFDTNNGLNIAATTLGPPIAITRAMPEPGNMLAPTDFSRFAVASGLPPESGGFVTYDNLFWPGGSPPTATDYQVHGGFLDIYGLLFSIGDGRVVNIWSNGATDGVVDYGASVSTAARSLDYAGGGVVAVATPEPGSSWLVGVGGVMLAGALVGRGRRRQPTASV